MRPAILFALLAACQSSPSTERATIADLELEIPTGWTRRTLSNPSREMVEWRSPDDDRDALTVIRTDERPMFAGDLEVLERHLVKAQSTLRDGAFSSVTRFTTTSGMQGFQLSGSFVPPGAQQRHARIHAVIVHGSRLVHVIFTSPSRELDTETFTIARNTLRKLEG
jgi:hypothetical protein